MSKGKIEFVLSKITQQIHSSVKYKITKLCFTRKIVRFKNCVTALKLLTRVAFTF